MLQNILFPLISKFCDESKHDATNKFIAFQTLVSWIQVSIQIVKKVFFFSFYFNFFLSISFFFFLF